jgi:flagellin FlaB
MNLIQKGHRHTHRGIIGIESAIVLIAFVIVAAALAFVVLNMGFTTAQKAKTTIVSTLSEAGTTLEIEGKVIGSAYQPGAGQVSSLNVTSYPIKISGGGDSVNLNPASTAIKYLSNLRTYDNVYNGTLNTLGTFTTLQSAVNAAGPANVIVPNAKGIFRGQSPYLGYTDSTSDDWPTRTTAFIYWTVASNTNDILESGEHANIALVFASGDRPKELDSIRIELIPSSGASLTVTRQVPNITTAIVDLG